MERRAHISVDDVFYTLRWLSLHRPRSIFDMDFFGKLKRWHLEYGAKFSLYVFATDGEFHISQVPTQYLREFQAESHWLKFGFHAPGIQEDPVHNNRAYFHRNFLSCSEWIHRLAGDDGVCRCLRLHLWEASSPVVDLLKQEGVTTLLCRDREGLSYDLSVDEAALVKERGWMEKNGMLYRRTDFRYDDDPNLSGNLQSIINQASPYIILFGHERYFNSRIGEIESAISILSQHGYTFVAQ